MTPQEYVQRKAAASGSSFYYAFLFLPPERRRAITAFYAFCREVDDVADEDSKPVAQRRAELAAWRADIRRACEGGQPEFPVNRELQPVIQKYGLAYQHFDELIQDRHGFHLRFWLFPIRYPFIDQASLFSIFIFCHSNTILPTRTVCRQHEYTKLYDDWKAGVSAPAVFANLPGAFISE